MGVRVTVGATAEGMVAGDAVNTASRVQSVAEPGQVWVDEATRSLSSAAIAFEDAGEHGLKGKAEPVHLYRARAVVAAVGGAQRVDGLEAPLSGRDAELRLLKDLFHATASAGRPRLVVLDGEAGVGKSRLAWEFEKYIDGLASTVRWHRGRCLSYGEGVAFWALAEAIRGRLGLVESDFGDVVAQHLEAALATFVPENERDWLRPRLAVLLGASPAGGFAREDLFAAWTAFLEQVGGDEAVVLVLDDAQYADDGLLDFLDHLLVSAQAGIFVLALARPELLARRGDLGGRRASVIQLEALDDTAMAGLVDGLVVGLPESVRAALVERAEGVPLFAVETVRALIDRDLVVPREGRYVLAAGDDFDVASVGAPASLQALVAARLDALTPAERRVVADASVLGVSFTRDGVHALSGDVADLEDVLAALRRKEILSVQTDRFSGERGQYRFVQGVVRQVAYATQSRRDRKARHLAAAAYLASLPDGGDDLAVVIAQHCLDAVDASTTGDGDILELTARARDLLERAAARAAALGSPAEALRLVVAALARTQDTADRARLHLAAAESAWDAGRYLDAIGYAGQATSLFDELGLPIQAGLAAAVHAGALASRQDNGGAIEIAEPRWTALDGIPGAERALLRLAVTLRRSHQLRGELDGEARYAERMILLAEAVDDPAALADGLIGMGIRFHTVGAPVAAMALHNSAAAIAREYDLPGQLAHALFDLATVQVSRDLPAALAYGREGMEPARRSGVSEWIDYTNANYLCALWAAGQLAEATRVLSSVAEAAVNPSMRVVQTVITAWLADAHGTPLPIISDIPEIGDTDSEAELAWLGNLELMQALAAGDVAGAAHIAEESIGHLLAAGGIDDDFMHLWPPLVQAALAAGDTTLAERLLQPVSTAAPGIVSPAVSAHLHRLRGLLGAVRGDDPAEVEAELRAGLDALDRFGAVGLRARAAEELGRWLLAQDRPDDAEPLLESARTTYVELGATGWLAQLAHATSPPGGPVRQTR